MSTVMQNERRQAHRRLEDLRLVRRDQHYQAAQRLCQAFFSHHRLDTIIETVLHVVLEATDADAGSVLLADNEAERLVFRYVVGNRAELVQGTSFPWDQGIAGAVFQSGQAEIILDAKKDPRHFGEVDRLAHYETHDMITVPLKKWDGDPIGVLNVLNKRNGPLNEDDLGLLTIIAAFAALAIHLAQTFEQAKKGEVVDLLGSIGHDLKNMLQPLVTGMELLKDEVDSIFAHLPAKQQETLQHSQTLCTETIDMVQHTSLRIQERVRQIASCVKGLSSPPQFKPLIVSDVVESVFRTLRFLADRKQLALREEGLETLPPIYADESRLFNALYNLVNNAIPETPKGGSITVGGRLESTNHHIQISVADTGRGIPADIRALLFTSRIVTTKKGGTGLGTKIVKDVVDAHNGSVWVESELGVGSTFYMRLPIDPLHTNQSPAPKP